jgi:hypothetical protein
MRARQGKCDPWLAMNAPNSTAAACASPKHPWECQGMRETPGRPYPPIWAWARASWVLNGSKLLICQGPLVCGDGCPSLASSRQRFPGQTL